MPIPNPRQDETHDEFISRCMADDVMNDEYPDEDQRYSICETSWDDRDKENGKMSQKMITKALEFTVKQDGAEDNRTLEFVGSTEKWDRDDEIILPSAWMLDNYRKNPVVLFAHDHFQPAIGKATSVGIVDGKLRFKVKFAEPEVYGFADTVYKLYKGGYMSAVSVGLMPLEWEYGKSAEEPYRIITSAELFELSMVNVGANPDALVSSRGVMKAMKEGAVDQTEMDELVMMLEEMVKRQEKDVEETKEEPTETPEISVVVENYSIEMLESDKFKTFLEENGLQIVKVQENKSQETEDPELDIYDVLLQDLKAGKEPHEKSHEDEDLTEELIALLKS